MTLHKLLNNVLNPDKMSAANHPSDLGESL